MTGRSSSVFRDIARLTRGAYCRFDPGAARQLAELLRAVAVYAAGGMAALESRTDAGAVKLIRLANAAMVRLCGGSNESVKTSARADRHPQGR